jgi:site-specific DNA-adenine methylase
VKIGPLLKWYGSKWSAAKRYPKPLPDLNIFEPYAGGAGYSLNYCDRNVVIWDDNDQLMDLWDWLIEEATQALILEIPVGVPEGTDIRKLGLTLGQALLLKHWQRTNNVGDCWTISAWGHKPGQWTTNTRARVAEEVQAVKHWEFRAMLLDEQGTYFIDPPYQYNYQYRFGPEERFDHQQLARDIRGIPPGSRIIACEAACPKTGTVPDYLPFVPSHRQVTSRRKATQSHHSQELIYTKDT